ncbi:MAG TPA: ABC transporter substrate-binding protein [Chloroflexota bacterium]|nr:ABC transporter substrate-binding protein [Chloroflexota bacterium]
MVYCLVLPLLASLLLAAGCSPASPRTTSSPGGAPTSAPAAPGSLAPAPTTAAAPPAQTVRYGYNPILSGAPIYLAQDRGYFAEQGFTVDYTPFDSAALMVAPVAAGQLDAMPAAPSPSLFNALARGVPIKALAAQSWSSTALMLRKELADSGQFHTLQDLRGRRVSFNVEGSPVDYTLRVALVKQGMSLNDVDVQRVSNTDLAAALANGAVDAGVVPEPVPVLIESRGIGVRFGDVQEIAGHQTGSMLAVGPGMLDRGDDTVTRFLVAYLKGLRDEIAAVQDDKLVDPATLDVISKWTNIPADTIGRATLLPVPADGRIDAADVNQQQEFWVQAGLVPTRADLGQFLEPKYVEAALAQLR